MNFMLKINTLIQAPQVICQVNVCNVSWEGCGRQITDLIDLMHMRGPAQEPTQTYMLTLTFLVNT